jgi:hypothetical protein
MTLEELKKHPDGVCLGYSTIGYLLKNKPELCGGIIRDFVSDDEIDKVKLYPDKLYPLIGYFKNKDTGEEKLLCRLMIEVNKQLSPIGLIAKLTTYPKMEMKKVSYVGRTMAFPLDYDIDKFYEVKSERRI